MMLWCSGALKLEALRLEALRLSAIGSIKIGDFLVNSLFHTLAEK
jgi:hypothetical protein